MTQAMASQLADDIATIRSWSRGAAGIQLAEVDTINVVIGDGANPLVAGIAAAIIADFNAFITGCVLQEFDGTTGSVAVKIEQAVPGAAPTWTTITPTSPPAIASGRYYADPSACTTWADQNIDRGSILRYSIVSAATITRILVAVRIRRLEP